MQNLTVVEHPLIQHKLTLMRRVDTPTVDFRRLLREIAMLLAYEITRDLPLTTQRIQTPLRAMSAPVLAGKKLCFV
ncbi:MAG: uracil phosphoribosyltransferase, partial [Candidatus Competibacteraceae bacterium]|nr:uracil phosphoribosyltransferase [Candidatus Competibacteraceae bacterium]